MKFINEVNVELISLPEVNDFGGFIGLFTCVLISIIALRLLF